MDPTAIKGMQYLYVWICCLHNLIILDLFLFMISFLKISFKDLFQRFGSVKVLFLSRVIFCPGFVSVKS